MLVLSNKKVALASVSEGLLCIWLGHSHESFSNTHDCVCPQSSFVVLHTASDLVSPRDEGGRIENTLACTVVLYFLYS